MPNNPTETQENYGLFWEKLAKYLKDKGSRLIIDNPQSREYRNIKTDYGSIYLKLIISRRNNKKSIEVYLDNPVYNKEIFNQLQKDEQAIKQELGVDISIPFDGRELPRCKRGRIVYKQPFYLMDKTEWDEECKWFKDMIAKFDEVFTPRLEKITQDLKKN